MPITVVISNADGIIHGTDNGKKTGCGIKYNSGDNLRKYKQGEVLTDLIIAMKTLNCEKCRRILSTKMIKEDRKAENKREKEERKRIAEAIKRGELDADGNPIVKNTEETTENVQEQEVETSPQEVAQPTPIVEPIAQNEPVEQSVVETDTSNQTISQPTIDAQTKYQTEDEEISQYIEEPQPEPIKTAPVVDDDLAQFMVNPEELKASEPEPVAPKKPLTDINDILADLDALMSNMSIKKNDPIDIKKDFTPIQEDTSYSEELPTIDEVTPTQEDTSYSEELPTIDEVIPTQEDTSYSEELPTIDEVIPTQDVSSYSEELPTIDEVIPTQDVSSYSEELPTIDEVIPTQEDTSYSEELPTIDEVAPIQEDTSYTEELPTIDEVAPIQEVNNTIPTTNIPTGYPNIPQNQPTYTQPVVPTPMPQPTPIPQYYYNVYGEAIPITYNAQNQPVFTVPVTYDAQGQPRPVQMAQPTPSPYIQQNPYMSNQPTYVQPVQPQQNVVPNPPPTRVVRADAPPKVSKPVENKPFDFSIFEKEDKKPVFTASENRIFVDSIEEALSQLGVETDSSKDKENEVVPEFQEYVAPTKSSKPVTPKQETPKTAPVLSEAERKKREKMDAKLKKEWEKKGLDPNDWKRRKHI